MYGKITDTVIEIIDIRGAKRLRASNIYVEMALEMTKCEANCKLSQDSEVADTSESSASEEDEDVNVKSGIKPNSIANRAEMYSKPGRLKLLRRI